MEQPRTSAGRTRRPPALVLGAALGAFALVTGCTTGEAGGPAPEASPSVPSSPDTRRAAPPDPADLTLAVHGPAPVVAAYRDLAQAFERSLPGNDGRVSVTVRVYRDAARTAAAAASADPPDVLLVEHQFAPELVAQDLVQPVNALLEERGVDFGDGYQRAGLTAFSAQAALQCMPHDVSPTVVYYNPDLVDLGAADPDDEEVLNPVDGWTWEQFAAVARDAARGPGDALHLEPGLAAVAPFVWSAGDEIVDDPGAPTTLMLSEDGRDAVAQVMALVRDPELTPTARELGRAGAVDRFRQGRLAMIVGTRALTPQLRQAAGVEFDVMPLPSLGVVRTLLRPTAYCISARTEATDAAADLVAFAVRRRGASLLARTGHVVPSNVAVANSAAFTQSALPPESAFVFNEGVRRSQAFPFHPAWPELLATTEDDFQRMFQAPVVDLETLLLEIDAASRRVLAAETLATDVPDED